MMTTYWASGEPQDKAVAYAIQGGAMAWVLSIDGELYQCCWIAISTDIGFD